jgi:ABC-type dipeptide/oligopeptide/nickel transport system ATPase subunit
MASPVFISDVEDVLALRGLGTPDLAMLQATHQSYRALLLQPSGPIYADTQRIGHFDPTAAAARADAFLAMAAERGDQLVVTPEYFLPVSSLVQAAKGGHFPAEGALWVLGCESMTPARLASFKDDCAGHCDVIYEEDPAPAVQGNYFDPVAYCFITQDADKNFKRVVLFQFKTAPSRDDHGFENKQLRCGRAIYRFQGKDGYIKLSTIICSDALDLGEDLDSNKKLSDRAILIHIQLNPKPKHTDYRRYRNEVFRRSPVATDCDIICLNWAHNVVQHDSPAHSNAWKNESGSAWYVPERRCSVKDDEVANNEAKGLYYTWHEKRRHVLHFHYDEAVFALTVPKVMQDGPAVHDVLIGPQLFELESSNLTADIASGERRRQSDAAEETRKALGACRSNMEGLVDSIRGFARSVVVDGWLTRVEPMGTFASLVALQDEFLAATTNASGLRSYLAIDDDIPLVEVQARIAAVASAFKHADQASRSDSESSAEQRYLTKKIQDWNLSLGKYRSEEKALLEAGKVLDDLIENASLENATREALDAIGGQINEVFSRIHSPQEYEYVGNPSVLLRTADGHAPRTLDQVSTGQRAAFALSIFLARNRTAASAPPVLLIDDPIAHIDDLNALSFLDYLRDLAVNSGRQIFFATADTRVASLFSKKFSFLGESFKTITLVRSTQVEQATAAG